VLVGEQCFNKDVNGWYRTRDSNEFYDELVRLSALDVEAQPAIVKLIPTQLTEGPNAGMWALRVDLRMIEKKIT
jgi:hypothetical protein